MTKSLPAGPDRSPRSVTELVQWLCRDTVWAMHAQDSILNDRTDAGSVTQTFLMGQVIGLRHALCLAKGWDPQQEADKEGRADQFIKNWHNLPGHCDRGDDCGMW